MPWCAAAVRCACAACSWNSAALWCESFGKVFPVPRFRLLIKHSLHYSHCSIVNTLPNMAGRGDHFDFNRLEADSVRVEDDVLRQIANCACQHFDPWRRTRNVPPSKSKLNHVLLPPSDRPTAYRLAASLCRQTGTGLVVRGS